MATPDVSNDGSLEAQSDGPVVAGIVDKSREGIDRATDGTCRIMSLFGAGGRFITKPIATAGGEVWRSVRETIEAGRDAAQGGQSSEDEFHSRAA